VLLALGDAAITPALIPDVEHYESVVAYDGAVDDTVRTPVEVAPEIVQLSFWTPEYCRRLVAVVEALDLWSKDDTDPVPGDEVSLMTVSPRLFAAIEADIGRRIVPRLRRLWPEFAWSGLQDAFVLRYAARGPGPSSLPLHHDVAQISASVRLNAGYTGGELVFPRQRYDNGQVPIGSMVAWPSLVTHPHRAAAVSDGTKYGLTIWWRLPT
jgi:hypothetical protein